MEESTTSSTYAGGRTSIPDLAAPFPEWAEPVTQSPMRQGDVIAAVSQDASLWRQLLIVITADCDLARSKHGGALTCVPVLGLEQYLLLFRYEKLRDPLAARMTDRVIQDLAEMGSDVETPRITPDRLRQWLVEEDLPTVISALAPLELPERTVALLKALRSVCARQPESISGAVEILAACKIALEDAKSAEKGRSAVAADFAGALKNLPGDVLLLNSVSPVHVGGYAAYLRHIVEVAESAVATSYARLPNDATYIRISRVRAPYVYALTQQFAAVFASIGLPAEYEQARDAISTRIRNGSYL